MQKRRNSSISFWAVWRVGPEGDPREWAVMAVAKERVHWEHRSHGPLQIWSWQWLRPPDDSPYTLSHLLFWTWIMLVAQTRDASWSGLHPLRIHARSRTRDEVGMLPEAQPSIFVDFSLPQAVKHLPIWLDPEHDVICGGVVDKGSFGMHKEHIRHPDLFH